MFLEQLHHLTISYKNFSRIFLTKVSEENFLVQEFLNDISSAAKSFDFFLQERQRTAERDYGIASNLTFLKFLSEMCDHIWSHVLISIFGSNCCSSGSSPNVFRVLWNFALSPLSFHRLLRQARVSNIALVQKQNALSALFVNWRKEKCHPFFKVNIFPIGQINIFFCI